MDSFYGGKRGYSFILKPQNTIIKNEHGAWERIVYWRNKQEIERGVQSGALSYGEYAVITEEGPSYSSEHGKIYRVTKDNNLELVGKIGNPAPLYPLEIINDDQETQSLDFPFLDDAQSTDSNFRVYWKTIYDDVDEPQAIGVGFKVPRPVFSVTNIPSTLPLFDSATELQPAGIQLEPVESGKVHYAVTNVVPPSVFMGSQQEREGLGEKLQELNLGDLWFENRDSIEDIIPTRQTTTDIKQLFNKTTSETKMVYFDCKNNPPEIVPIYDVFYSQDKKKWDYLYFVAQSSVDIKVPVMATGIRVSFKLKDPYEQYSVFDRFQIAFGENGEDTFIIQGNVGEKISLTESLNNDDDHDPASIDPTTQNYSIHSIIFFNTYFASSIYPPPTTAEQKGYALHNDFRMHVYDNDDEETSQVKNTKENILNATLSFGITWYLSSQEED